MSSCRGGFFVVLLLLSALLGCGSSPPAPVEDRNRRAAADSRLYTVQRGDTLYSIAFRYGLDYRGVAAANSIPGPYTIFPGQKIYLKEAPVPVATKASSSKSSSTPQRASTSAAKVSKQPTPTVTKTSPTKSTTVAPAKTPVYSGRNVSAWRWPTSGSVTRGYSSSVHKGIDIGGKRGDSVVAVAEGKVVYAGTGIVGFGELLIVKHNELYLSAYGHNDRLLVGEGDLVKAGQKIAAKGSTGTDTVKLHFEIRKEGKPVDPQKVLPRR
jgi:lipoprotein NlpD